MRPAAMRSLIKEFSLCIVFESLVQLGFSPKPKITRPNQCKLVTVLSRSVFLLGFSGSNSIRPIPVVHGGQSKDQKYTKSGTNWFQGN